MRELEREDLRCLHKMYLFLLENHRLVLEKHR
jgi:hypothetical protein